MNTQQQIHYWAHMLDEAFSVNLSDMKSSDKFVSQHEYDGKIISNNTKSCQFKIVEESGTSDTSKKFESALYNLEQTLYRKLSDGIYRYHDIEYILGEIRHMWNAQHDDAGRSAVLAKIQDPEVFIENWKSIDEGIASKSKKQILYWAHMLDEAFDKDIHEMASVSANKSIDNAIDKAYFDAIFSGDQKTLRRIVRNHASKKFASSCIGDTILYHGSSEDNIYKFDTTNNQHFLYTFDNKNAALTYTAEEEMQFFPLGPMSVEDELNQMMWKQLLVLTPVLMKDGKFVVDFKDDQCLIPVLSDKPQYNNDDFDEEICKAYGRESSLFVKLKLSDLDKSIPFMTYVPENAKQNLDVEFFIVNTETGKMFKNIAAARDYVRQNWNTPSNIHNGVYPLYVMAKNEFDFDADGEVWNGLTFNGEEYQSTDDIAYWASQNNYDIAYIENVEDNPENGIEQAGMQDEYIVMTDSRFIKSALPITYDDNNHIIPLSKRFNFSIDDIRF